MKVEHNTLLTVEDKPCPFEYEYSLLRFLVIFIVFSQLEVGVVTSYVWVLFEDEVSQRDHF